MADDDSSDLSSLSSLSAPPTDDESDIQLERQHGILKFFHKVDKNPALDLVSKQAKEAEPGPRPKRELLHFMERVELQLQARFKL